MKNSIVLDIKAARCMATTSHVMSILAAPMKGRPAPCRKKKKTAFSSLYALMLFLKSTVHVYNFFN